MGLRALLWHKSHSAQTAPATAGEVQICLDDYDALERDCGTDCAAEIHLAIGERLRGELGRFDELTLMDGGRYQLHVRDSHEVDLEKIADNLLAVIGEEPVCLRRSLVECSATAKIVFAPAPAADLSTDLSTDLGLRHAPA